MRREYERNSWRIAQKKIRNGSFGDTDSGQTGKYENSEAKEESNMRKVRIFFGLMVVMLSLIAANMTVAEEGLIAVGDKFEITENDLNAFKDYFLKQNFRSTDDEYKKAIVKLWLFSEEAKSLGLDKDSQMKQDNAEDDIKFRNELQKSYIATIVKAYPVSDLAAESFYWANPDYFLGKKDENNPQPEVMPLDSAMKEKIKLRIAIARKPVIVYEEADRLWQKYHVRMCDTKEGCR